MSDKGTQNPEEERSDFVSDALDLTSTAKLDNIQKKADLDYKAFLIEKLGLNDDRSNLEKNEQLKKEYAQDPLPFYNEFLKEKLNFDVIEPDFDKIERENKIFEEKLLRYFSEIKNVITNKITLSQEEINTLKKFLLDYYLSVRDIEKILRNTDFEAKYKNIDKKKKKFLRLGLIEKVTKPSRKAYISKLDGRKEYCKLTPSGIFCVLKEIQREDIGHLFMKPDFENRVFEVYKDDPLFELFVKNDLIDMTTLSEIKNYDVRWIFVDYLKNICQEINKELNFFTDFQKNGVKSGIAVKWNQNLNKKNKTEWNKFIERILDNVIFLPPVTGKDRKPSESIIDLNISDRVCSFSYCNRKYSIEIEKMNLNNIKTIRAKYCVNGEEYIRFYDPDIGKEQSKKYDEIAVEKRKHCFVLTRISRESEDYVNSLTKRFLMPIRFLKAQLGYSILLLFPDTYNESMELHLSHEYKGQLTEDNSELAKLASDLKIRRLIADDFYKDLDKRYHTFLKFRK